VQLCEIMKTSSLYQTRLLMLLLTGDPIEAMEAAKKIIGRSATVAPVLLLEVAQNKKYKMWSRIGAVYALGFLGLKLSVPRLIRILEESGEPLTLRCHAAEALGNVQDPRAVATLERILMQKEPPSLKKWCIYALAQIGTSRAKMILTRIKEQKPKGLIAKEINLAFRHLR
jgi:HEAT repeat protein